MRCESGDPLGWEAHEGRALPDSAHSTAPGMELSSVEHLLWATAGAQLMGAAVGRAIAQVGSQTESLGGGPGSGSYP